MCDKNYGRRDYLDRHIRTHDPDNFKRKGTSIDWGGTDVLMTDEDGNLQAAKHVIVCEMLNFFSS